MDRRIVATGARGAALALACALAAGCAPSGRYDASVAHGGAEVRLAPQPAFAAARLTAIFSGSASAAGAMRMEWRRNGAVIDGATGPVLEPSRFARGDVVSVHAWLPTASGGGREISASVKIANSPPRIASVGVTLEPGPGPAELHAAAEALDADGDPVRLSYAWAVNGEPLDGERGATLPVASLARGDRVTVSVVARDGEVESLAAESEAFVLENRPPAITSAPTAPRAGDAVFEYRAAAKDPDGDPLRWTVVIGPPGMTVDAEGGVRWELPDGEARRGEFPVKLRAADPHGGEAVQEFTIRL